MKKIKDIIIIGFAIFASLFGAGNLVIPSFLGFNAGADWWLVALGFMVSAVIIPLLAVLAHAKLQGTMLDFGNKVSKRFSLIFCTSIYLIAISLPIPRTSSVTHEMAIAPFFDISSLWSSTIYFALVFLFVINRNNILDLIGKKLTPILLVILLLLIIIGFFSSSLITNTQEVKTPIIDGFIEGYQTYDAFGALLIGGVVIISLKLNRKYSIHENRVIIRMSGLMAAFGMIFIYTGLIYLGAFYHTDDSVTRSELLIRLSSIHLGNTGNLLLSLLVSIACFTTAVSVIVGVADFFKGILYNAQRAYIATALFACLLGIVVGQLGVEYIIKVAMPALLFIYPTTIVLIVLNIINDKYTSKRVFRGVVLITFLFCIPEFLKFIFPELGFQNYQNYIPFATYNLGWVLPSLFTFFAINFYENS